MTCKAEGYGTVDSNDKVAGSTSPVWFASPALKRQKEPTKASRAIFNSRLKVNKEPSGHEVQVGSCSLFIAEMMSAADLRSSF